MHKGLVVLIIVLSIVLLAGGIYVHSVSKGLTEEEPVPYDPGDVFITNLKDGSGLVKVRLMLELKNKKAAENLTKVNYRLLQPSKAPYPKSPFEYSASSVILTP
jgi:flagellar basal body-associated protein FliL